MVLIIVLLALPAFIVLVDFVDFLFSDRQAVGRTLFRITEVLAVVIMPLLYGNFGIKNECCGEDFETAVFSPDHQLTIAVFIMLCLLAYFYSSYRKKIATPIIEILVNALLMIGIVLNVFIAIQTNTLWLALGGNMPIILLALMVLVKNQQLVIEYTKEMPAASNNVLERVAWSILNLKPIYKFPILFLLCLPVLIVITSVLLIFGQKPDSLIKAFTDTYKHGFSQLDYQCDNVDCGGHFLCSVAANGHHAIVKPQRRGIRNGHNITCNRQLLVSNAFEDLLQQRLPLVHRFIRRRYNKVGDIVHRYYSIFNNKFVADVIYVLMKPLEWFFIVTLYTCDRKPENRIAKQYLARRDRQAIDALMQE